MVGPSTVPRRHAFPVLNDQFFVDEDYEFVKELGQGAYGIVCSAKNTKTGKSVAIKKVTKIFTKKILTKRALRELKLLHHFRGHKNITCLYDMDIVNFDSFNEVYLYEELMEADLHAIIRSGQPLTDAHFQSFIYQTLCGLKYIHSASVLHRDLKPGNLLVNADCELKICDFGLARGFETDPALAQATNQGFMTEYVATRWYRAPEIMLSFQNYTTAIDMWSVGCILAELLGGRPIFKGRDYVDQLNQILNYLGTPSETTLRRVGSPRAQDYIRSLPYKQGVSFAELYPGANPEGLDLLSKLLAFDPSERITCNQALRHPYLKVWHDPEDEIDIKEKFDFSFESEDSTEGMKQLIINEVVSFRQSVRPNHSLQPAHSSGVAANATATPSDSAPAPSSVNAPVGQTGAAESSPASQSKSSGSDGHKALPIPSREVVMSSPTNSVVGGTSGATTSTTTTVASSVTMNAQDDGPLIHSPVDDHPAQDLDAELVARDF
ncbi:Mitogen-activated protein kinase [Puccinia graminis f. sp. tritici]|uniref:Mitogen-activated protein kinase n=3 Tax=Puccinia graminis f. sp. tritici TaxID=56615 RepID=E3L2N5_PUCGT|nr:CMGC/MAPK protein kinase [Puccinia graminis f. sp. tritici CRL 75-36-700-3]EFP90786.1 CMGC/MAPK protein kinase [Puccinia graminis f. sp. tritici CRL 75-36-700-3]KAA1108479.1 Mitogen-activated protein kinase [Puccinia graminis f. sp. tritici]